MAAALDDLEDGALVRGVVVAELGRPQVLRDRRSGGPARRGPKSLDNPDKWNLIECGKMVKFEKLGPGVDGGSSRSPQRGSEQNFDTNGDGAARPVRHAEDVEFGEC
eukprot:6029856-Pyramimonas_sp.AAC.1